MLGVWHETGAADVKLAREKTHAMSISANMRPENFQQIREVQERELADLDAQHEAEAEHLRIAWVLELKAWADSVEMIRTRLHQSIPDARWLSDLLRKGNRAQRCYETALELEAFVASYCADPNQPLLPEMWRTSSPLMAPQVAPPELSAPSTAEQEPLAPTEQQWVAASASVGGVPVSMPLVEEKGAQGASRKKEDVNQKQKGQEKSGGKEVRITNGQMKKRGGEKKREQEEERIRRGEERRPRRPAEACARRPQRARRRRCDGPYRSGRCV